MIVSLIIIIFCIFKMFTMLLMFMFYFFYNIVNPEVRDCVMFSFVLPLSPTIMFEHCKISLNMFNENTVQRFSTKYVDVQNTKEKVSQPSSVFKV